MKILIVAAHPDDEILGAGGAISRMIKDGNEIAILTMSMISDTREKKLSERQEESLKILGEVKRYEYNLNAMRFRKADRHEAVKMIECVIRKESPEWIITHFPGDLHDDHRATAEFVQEAVRLPQRIIGYRKPIKKLMYMEVATSTDWSLNKSFEPNTFIEVKKRDLEKKVDALGLYEGVLRAVPHPRNRETIFATARYRGSQIGVKYAEAFLTRLQVI